MARLMHRFSQVAPNNQMCIDIAAHSRAQPVTHDGDLTRLIHLCKSIGRAAGLSSKKVAKCTCKKKNRGE
jgi:hypothetical protein